LRVEKYLSIRHIRFYVPTSKIPCDGIRYTLRIVWKPLPRVN
jgi:hypothetical protein